MASDYLAQHFIGDMLKFVLLLCAVAGFNARPLQYNALRIQNGGWVVGAPQLVQNDQEFMGSPEHAEHHKQVTEVEPQWEVVDMNQKGAPTEERRQGTEPSKRFLVDLNTGLLKEYISEMDRRAEVYIPTYKSEFRQGTQNSRATLVNIRTGQQLPLLSEMQRRVDPLSEFRQGTEYSEAALMKLRKDQIMDRTEFRQGTQNSRATLVNIKTGQQLPKLSEMQRRAEPLSEFRQGTEYSEAVLMKLRKDQIMGRTEFRQGTQNSRATLVNIKTGQQLPQLSEMQRRAEPLSEFRQGTEYSEATLVELRTAQMIRSMKEAKQETFHQPVVPQIRRQGTELSGHVLVDLNTGLVKEQVNEMERSHSGYEFKQSNEHNLVALKNPSNTQIMGKAGNDKTPHTVQDVEDNEVFPEFKRGIQYSQSQKQHLMNHHLTQALQSNEVEIPPAVEEFRNGLEHKHANIIDRQIMNPAIGKRYESK